ncbi:polysaccharide lyase family protein [Actinocrispum wychmicini]|uniref:Glycosyl hydrolase family 38 n=1 Tax=Actinocrispum wychmicini TaxID=1213861 RepID=A0A4R2JHL9_9PSEU|nr:polysaccharide lyase family protein [Actinocrispum wychmicini]TCO55889.1 glycosyl hydrolase family 38 [Actinocrispum wychmicini]
MTDPAKHTSAGGPPVWRIGDPLQGPDQFAAELVRDEDWVFVVGESAPARDWPARQPGPLDAHGGWREHTTTVRFTVDEPDPDGYLLRLGVQSEHGPCPQLRVTVNGRTGLVFPELVVNDRSRVNPMSLNGGEGVLEISLPPGSVVAGGNELTFTTTAVAGPGDEAGRHREQFEHLFGSQLCWVFVELVAGVAEPDSPEVHVRPLPFYRREPGGLHELVDVYVTFPAGQRPSAVVADGRRYAVESDRTFGQHRVRITVAEFTGQRLLPVEVVGPAGSTLSVHQLTPCRKWTLHLIPHVHLDLGYTDYQGKVVELHSRNLDRALEILRGTPDYRFMVDGSMILDQYLRSRGPAAANRVLDAVRSGTLSLNAYYALFLTGLASLEECCRATYLSARLAEEYDLPVTYANLTDVPSYSHAMPSLLRAAGIEAFMGVQNHTRGGNADSDLAHRQSPCVWEGPDGAELLTYFADSYNQLRFLATDPPTTVSLASTLPHYLSFYDRPDYLPTDLPIVGMHSDNEDLDDGEATFVRRWNELYEWPRLRWSTPADYFETVAPLAHRLPRWKGDGGSYWEDGAGTAAVIVATYRAAQSLLPAVESLHALVATDATPSARDALDDAWAHLLIGCEHTWTSTHASKHPHSQQAIDQLAWKRHHVESAARLATDEARRGVSRLAERISMPGPGLVVYNSASWARPGVVTAEIPPDRMVTDEDGHELPAEREPVDGLDRLRVTVPEVPAFGYRVLPIRPRTHRTAPSVTPAPSTLTAARWELELDPATSRVTRLTHRSSGVRLVDAERDARGWALGELLYVTGGGGEDDRGLDPHNRTSLFDAKVPLPPPQLSIVPASLGPAELARTPGGWVIRSSGHAPSIPLVRWELRLYDDSDRVDVEIFLSKQRVLAKESVYVAFLFALTDPVVRFDRHLGWVDPAVDHTPGACNEWFTASNVVAVTGTEGTVLWSTPDTPLFTVGEVVSGRWPTSFQPDSALLSWAMNNYWFTNTPASQDGALTLHYSFEYRADWDPAAAARFGREVRTPLVAAEVIPNDKFRTGRGTLTEPAASLFPLRLPAGVAGTVHRARTGTALILRLQDLSGQHTDLRLDPPPGVTSIERCTTDERRLAPVPTGPDGRFVVDLPANGLVNLRLDLRA